MGFVQKGVAVSANSSPGLDCLPDICSMDLEVHPCRFSYLYNDLQINFTKSVDYKKDAICINYHKDIIIVRISYGT